MKNETDNVAQTKSGEFDCAGVADFIHRMSLVLKIFRYPEMLKDRAYEKLERLMQA